MFSDKYKEIKSASTGAYKEKGSKFIAYSFPVHSEDNVKEKLEEVKKLEHSRWTNHSHFLGEYTQPHVMTKTRRSASYL